MDNKKENSFGDVYVEHKLSGSILTDKKSNVRYWDGIDEIAQNALEQTASAVGINISDWGDLDDIKEVVGLMTKVIEKRFGVTFPFVDENY